MATNNFRAEIQRLIEQKRDEIRALEVTLEMVSSDKTTDADSSSDSQEISDGETVDLDSLGVATDDYGPTLAERVRSALTHIPADQEFTVAHVEALLKKKGFALPRKSSRARLAMIMGELEDQELVIRTAKPKGFKPHKFKLTKQGNRNFSLVK